MTANRRRSTEPLSPPLMPSLALGPLPAPDDGRITLLPWRLRRESVGRSPQGAPDNHGGRSQSPPTGDAPLLTVADVMTHDVACVSTATPVSQIAGVLA